MSCSLSCCAKVFTGESDVKALIGHREVREETDLSGVVAKKSSAKGERQCRPGQSPQGLRETTIFCD